MHVSPSFACLLIFMVSDALAQKSSQTKSDLDKAELRGPVKTVLKEQTFSAADGQQFLMSTTTEYALDGRILEQRTKNTNGSEWVVSHTYAADGRLLGDPREAPPELRGEAEAETLSALSIFCPRGEGFILYELRESHHANFPES